MSFINSTKYNILTYKVNEILWMIKLSIRRKVKRFSIQVTIRILTGSLKIACDRM